MVSISDFYRIPIELEYFTTVSFFSKNMLTLNLQLPNPTYCYNVSQLLTYDDLKKQYF